MEEKRAHLHPVASIELPQLSSAFMRHETEPEAVNINGRNLDFELAKTQEALLLKHERDDKVQRRVVAQGIRGEIAHPGSAISAQGSKN